MLITSLFLVVFGSLGAAFSFIKYSAAALPYQEPTDDMLLEQPMQLNFWGLSILINLLVIVIGVWIKRSVRNKS